MHYALCTMHMHYALCTMHYALHYLCTMHYALGARGLYQERAVPVGR